MMKLPAIPRKRKPSDSSIEKRLSKKNVTGSWLTAFRFSLALQAASLTIVLSSANVANAGDQTFRAIGDGVALAVPVAAAITSFGKQDWKGEGQLLLDEGATIGATEILKPAVGRERPNGTHRSFPSTQASVAFAGASYLGRRYGWQYGLPGYMAGVFTGAAHISARENDWLDILGSAALATGAGALLVRPVNDNVAITPWSENGHHGVMLTLDY